MNAIENTAFEDIYINQLGVHLHSDNDYCRFSEAPVWALQRHYFLENTPLPSPTVNWNLLAASYVETIIAYWLDLLALNQYRSVFYIVELGAGAGRLAYLVLGQLQEKLNHYDLEHIQWVYVASDVAENNLQAIEARSEFSPYFEKGCLETACYDAESTKGLRLRQSHQYIDNFDTPPLIIANYVLSHLTQELFYIHFGQAYEGMVAVNRVNSGASQPTNDNCYEIFPPESLFNTLQFDFQWSGKIPSTRNIDDKWLRHYIERLDSTPFLLPSAVIGLFDRLFAKTDGNFLLLSLDTALVDEAALRNRELPPLTEHGNAGMALPLDLLAKQCHNYGGLAWYFPCCDTQTVACAWLFNRDIQHFGATENSINQHLVLTDYTSIQAINQPLCDTQTPMTTTQLLALLRLNHYDASLLNNLAPKITQTLLTTPVELNQADLVQWRQALSKLWQTCLPLCAEDVDNSFLLGLLAIALQHWSLAKTALESYLYWQNILLPDERKNKAVALYNLAICFSQTGDVAGAEQLLQSALSLNPDCPDSQALLQDCEQCLNYWQEQKWLPVFNDGSIDNHNDLILEPITLLHTNALWCQYRDPNIAVLTRLPDFDNEADVEHWINTQQRQQDTLCCAVIHRQYGFVGVVNIRYVQDNAYFYFWIGKDFQHQGFGQQAARLLLDRSKSMGIKWIFTSAYADNCRSHKALRQLNFIPLAISALAPDDQLNFYCYVHNPIDYRSVSEKNITFKLQKFLQDIHSSLRLL